MAYLRARVLCVFTCLACSLAWRARVLYVLACLACFACLRSWPAYVFGVLYERHAWCASKNWHAWPASQNDAFDVLGVLHRMACLAYFIK